MQNNVFLKNEVPFITCCCPSPFDFSLHGSKNQAPISSVFLTCKIKSYMRLQNTKLDFVGRMKKG